MSGLKEIRTRIASIKTTRQVTNAMKMVSAAKLKKAQDAIIHFRPYANRLNEILKILSANLDDKYVSVYTQPREENKILVIVITSNRGLCGGLNANIVKKAVELVYTKYKVQFAQKNVDFIAVGKQGERMMKNAGLNIVGNQNGLIENPTFENVSIIVNELMEKFKAGEYSRIELVYNEFVNAAMQEQMVMEFLPAQPKKAEKTKHHNNYIFEPSLTEIMEELIPRTLKVQFHKAMLDSSAAEHGARMTSMHKATDNATELLGELTLQYNKARQSAITSELLEITAGAEALKE